MFRAYLKVNDACPACGEELHHQRADDAPPYLTIFIVGHVVAAMLMIADERWPQLDMWIHMVLWPLVATAHVSVAAALRQGRLDRLSMGAQDARIRDRFLPSRAAASATA